MSDDIVKIVQMQTLNVIDYAYEKVYAKVHQITNSDHSLHDIQEAHCRTLAQSLCTCTLDHDRDIMLVYFSAAVNQAGATNATAVNYVD